MDICQNGQARDPYNNCACYDCDVIQDCKDGDVFNDVTCTCETRIIRHPYDPLPPIPFGCDYGMICDNPYEIWNFTVCGCVRKPQCERNDCLTGVSTNDSCVCL